MEGESGNTDLEGRGKLVVQGAKEAKDEEGFEPVVTRASQRLAKKERQRELERERAEKGAQAKDEARRDSLRQHQVMAKATNKGSPRRGSAAWGAREG